MQVGDHFGRPTMAAQRRGPHDFMELVFGLEQAG